MLTVTTELTLAADLRQPFSCPVVILVVKQPRFLVQQNRAITDYAHKFFLYGCKVIF